MTVQGNSQNILYSLIPLEDFKTLLGLDDREDCLDFASVRNPGHEFLHGKNSTNLFQPPSLAAFCLIAATYTIEQYCKRRLVRRKNTDYLSFMGEYIFTLREYPVRRVLAVHAAAAAVTTALGENPTLSGVAGRAELTGKKYAPPKCAGTGRIGD